MSWISLPTTLLLLFSAALVSSAVPADEVCFFEHNGNQVLYRPIDDMEILEVRLADRPNQVIVVRDSDGDALLRSKDDLIFRRHLEPEEVRTLGLTVPPGKAIKVSEGEGCPDCRGTGYFGRTGIFEILPMHEHIRDLIMEGAGTPILQREAERRGMRTLRQSALRKLAEGITTFEEVVRVTGI